MTEPDTSADEMSTAIGRLSFATLRFGNAESESLWLRVRSTMRSRVQTMCRITTAMWVLSIVYTASSVFMKHLVSPVEEENEAMNEARWGVSALVRVLGLAGPFVLAEHVFAARMVVARRLPRGKMGPKVLSALNHFVLFFPALHMMELVMLGTLTLTRAQILDAAFLAVLFQGSGTSSAPFLYNLKGALLAVPLAVFAALFDSPAPSLVTRCLLAAAAVVLPLVVIAAGYAIERIDRLGFVAVWNLAIEEREAVTTFAAIMPAKIAKRIAREVRKRGRDGGDRDGDTGTDGATDDAPTGNIKRNRNSSVGDAQQAAAIQRQSSSTVHLLLPEASSPTGARERPRRGTLGSVESGGIDHNASPLRAARNASLQNRPRGFSLVSDRSSAATSSRALSFAVTEGSGTVPSAAPVSVLRGAALRVAGNAAVEESDSASVALIRVDWGGLDDSLDAETFAVYATQLTVAVDAALSRARRVCRVLCGAKWKKVVPDITKVENQPDLFIITAGTEHPTAPHSMWLAVTSVLVTRCIEAFAESLDRGAFPTATAGVSTGPVAGGLNGTSGLVWSVYGDTVNVAARVAGCTDDRITALIRLSPSAMESLRGDHLSHLLETRDVSGVSLKGKSDESTITEVVDFARLAVDLAEQSGVAMDGSDAVHMDTARSGGLFASARSMVSGRSSRAATSVRVKGKGKRGKHDDTSQGWAQGGGGGSARAREMVPRRSGGRKVIPAGADDHLEESAAMASARSVLTARSALSAATGRGTRSDKNMGAYRIGGGGSGDDDPLMESSRVSVNRVIEIMKQSEDKVRQGVRRFTLAWRDDGVETEFTVFRSVVLAPLRLPLAGLYLLCSLITAGIAIVDDERLSGSVASTGDDEKSSSMTSLASVVAYVLLAVYYAGSVARMYKPRGDTGGGRTWQEVHLWSLGAAVVLQLASMVVFHLYFVAADAILCVSAEVTCCIALMMSALPPKQAVVTVAGTILTMMGHLYLVIKWTPETGTPLVVGSDAGYFDAGTRAALTWFIVGATMLFFAGVRERAVTRAVQVLHLASEEVRTERDRFRQLVASALPPHVVGPLLRRRDPILDPIAHHDPETLVFTCDVAGFTTLSGGAKPAALLRMLHELFSIIDGCAQRHGVLKIGTVGDAWMGSIAPGGSRQDLVDRFSRRSSSGHGGAATTSGREISDPAAATTSGHSINFTKHGSSAASFASSAAPGQPLSPVPECVSSIRTHLVGSMIPFAVEVAAIIAARGEFLARIAAGLDDDDEPEQPDQPDQGDGGINSGAVTAAAARARARSRGFSDDNGTVETSQTAPPRGKSTPATHVEPLVEPVRIRCGVVAGPLSTGVIGAKLPMFRAWGGTLRSASACEARGTPGKVNVDKTCWKMLVDEGDLVHEEGWLEYVVCQ